MSTDTPERYVDIKETVLWGLREWRAYAKRLHGENARLREEVAEAQKNYEATNNAQRELREQAELDFIAEKRKKEEYFHALNRCESDNRAVYERAHMLEKELAEAKRVIELLRQDNHNLTEKVIPNIREQADARALAAETALKAQAAEAYADIDEWAAYAPEYFKSKWKIVETLKKWRDRFEPAAIGAKHD